MEHPKLYQRIDRQQAIMCDCYDEEFADIPVATEEAEAEPQQMPIVVVKKRK